MTARNCARKAFEMNVLEKKRKLRWTKVLPLSVKGIAEAPRSGVYRLVFFDISRMKYRVYFVGESKNLEEKLTSHLRGIEKEEVCKVRLLEHRCGFRAAAVSGQPEREKAEAALYRRFKPENITPRFPDLEPADINFC
jgi:hypothetical protein